MVGAKSWITYLELLSGAGNGTYSEEQIRALGTQVGLSEKEIENVVGVYNEYSTKLIENQWADIKTGVDNGTYDADYVRKWAIKNGYVDENGKLNAEAQAIYDKAVEYETERERETEQEEIRTWNLYGEQARNGQLSSNWILGEAKAAGYVGENGEWDYTPGALAAKEAYGVAMTYEFISKINTYGMYADIGDAHRAWGRDKSITDEQWKEIKFYWNLNAHIELEELINGINRGDVYSQQTLYNLVVLLDNAYDNGSMNKTTYGMYITIKQHYINRYGVKKTESSQQSEVEISGEAPVEIPMEPTEQVYPTQENEVEISGEAPVEIPEE